MPMSNVETCSSPFAQFGARNRQSDFAWPTGDIDVFEDDTVAVPSRDNGGFEYD